MALIFCLNTMLLAQKNDVSVFDEAIKNDACETIKNEASVTISEDSVDFSASINFKSKYLKLASKTKPGWNYTVDLDFNHNTLIAGLESKQVYADTEHKSSQEKALDSYSFNSIQDNYEKDVWLNFKLTTNELFGSFGYYASTVSISNLLRQLDQHLENENDELTELQLATLQCAKDIIFELN